MPACLDQPFLNYHFVKADRYDVSLMKTYALIYCINPPPPPSEPTTIALCHFVWPVGNAGHKLDRMRKHMTHLLDNFSKIYPSTPPESVPMLNNTYDWGKGEILFYPNMLFTTWDRGTHTLLDSHTAEVSWNKGYSHLMRFNKDYTKGLSIRKGDCDILAHSLKVEEPIVMKPYQPPVSNRKLIYTCVFGKKGYVQLLELLLVSIKLFGDIQNTDILIITESQFKEDIETISNIVGIPLNIQCLVLGKIMEPYYARLYIFNYENIAKYSTILYLDTDILVQHTLAPLLTHSLEDKIYAFKEGTIDSPDYGQQFFDFTINAENTPGFNSGVLLFPNTSTMHGLFQDCLQHITTHIQEGLPIPACPDQAFLNYHTIKRDLYEDTFINDYIMIYHHKVTFLPEKPTKTILYHFIWPQGNAEYKLQRMKSYMSHVLNNYTHLYPCNSLVKRDIVGKSLYWSNSSITFLQNKLLATIWREGSYEWLDTYTLNASFARHNHIVRFNETFDQAISVRTGDCDIQKHMENRSPFFYKDMEPCYIPPPVTSIVQTGRILFYFCVFCKEEYVTMFKLLLFSIRACTPLTKVDILVLTDRIVEASVQQVSKLLNIPIHTMIIEGIKTAHNASSARLDLFKYLPVYTYERVLYLDTDMLVQHDLTPLLTMPIKDCLYAVKGSEKGTDYCHGSWFFEDKAIMNRAEAFSAGTFLIKPTTAMRDIFIYTKHHITQTFVHNLPYPVCYEQPYLNFHCITAGKSDTQLLKPYLYLDHPTIEKPPAPLSEIAMIHYVDDNKMERMLPNLTRMVFEGIPSVPVEAALLNESYIWNGGRIQFLQNNIVATTWGTGTYQQVDTTSVLVSWKGFTHRLFFNEDRSEALSIRKGDCDMCKHTRIEDNRCSLIYACVFYNKDYIQLLRLLLLSIKMYSPLKQADFLVITSKEFEPLIQEVATEIQLPIRTMTLDITTIFQAACARLSIFDYPRIQDYAKLLYLDTDILVKGDLSTLLKIPLQDKLYALESGFTDSINFGVQFFQTPTKVTGLNSGTLLFPNSSILKALFHRIQNHINTYDGQPPYALDQPFINYHAIKDGLYENQALKPHVALFEEEQPANEESAIVCHFSFPIGNFGHKFYRMKNYFDKILSIATAFNETTDIQGKTYSWNKGFIKFHSTKLQTIWATGNYSRLDADRVLTSWRGSSHVLRLSPDRNSWFSIRLHDFEVVHGTLLDTMTPNFDPAMRTPLCEIMTKHGSDKGSKQHNYTTLYYNLLHTRQQEPLRIFEVGIGTTNLSITNNMGSNGTPGASLRGWAEFCPNAHIFAADIDKNILFEEDRIKTFYTDQLDRITIKGMWLHKELQEGFDLIVDDGLHTYDANVCFLENSIHKLRIGGYYIVEDIRNYDVPLFYAKLEGWRQAYPSYTFQLLLLENINLFDNTMLVIQRVE
jgi:lipopolysaccharide biosynthesis glycosyltransferase